jgi:glutathione S-transferase
MTTAPTVSLYGHWICPFVSRVAFALAERGIDHDLIDVPPSAVRGPDFVLPPEFVEHSPRLEVPMVRIGRDYLADSIPILEWLEDRITDASLLPSDDEGRALVRERMAWIDQHAFRAMGGVYYGVDPEKIDRAAAALETALAEMDGWLVEHDWLAGHEPSLADAVAMPIHVRLDGLRRLGFDRPLPSRIELHGQRCRQLAGWPAVEWSTEQTDEFVGRFEAFRRKQQAV